MLKHRLLVPLFIFVLAAFGFSSLAVADVQDAYVTALQDAGQYGAAVSRFEAEQVFMAGADSAKLTSDSGLRRDSHGFIQSQADDYEGFNPVGANQLALC